MIIPNIWEKTCSKPSIRVYIQFVTICRWKFLPPFAQFAGKPSHCESQQKTRLVWLTSRYLIDIMFFCLGIKRHSRISRTDPHQRVYPYIGNKMCSKKMHGGRIYNEWCISMIFIHFVSGKTSVTHHHHHFPINIAIYCHSIVFPVNSFLVGGFNPSETY